MSYSEIIEGKTVHILDNVISKKDIDDFYDYLSGLSYFKVEKANDDDELPKFSRDLRAKVFEHESIIGITSKNLIRNFYDEEYVLYRVTINLILKGDMEFPHRDVSIPRDDVTVLYYANSEWDYTWGGETIFYSWQDSVFGVLPKPGRFVVFEGYLEHKAGIPSYFSKQPRYTIGLKYISRKNLQKQINEQKANDTKD